VQAQIILGFDFGTKYIGVAVGQTVTRTANPLASLRAHNGVPEWDKVTTLINYWKPSVLMVGIPFALDGSEQTISYAARHFAAQLHTRYDLPIHPVDERYTTLEAKRYLYEQGGYKALDKSSIDGLSAKIIVECGLKDWGLE
jgi:putative Holliday junction resolvase